MDSESGIVKLGFIGGKKYWWQYKKHTSDIKKSKLFLDKLTEVLDNWMRDKTDKFPC